jgi:hypothetical protein
MRSDWLLRARAILNRQWDPIHLSRMPDADEWDWADEYDQYGDQLAALIEVGVSDEGLLTYLEWAEVAWIGRPRAECQGRSGAADIGNASAVHDLRSGRVASVGRIRRGGASSLDVPFCPDRRLHDDAQKW